MMTSFKLHLTRIAPGRALLHLGCLLRGGQWDFHWAGIRRELAGIVKPMFRFAAICGKRRQLFENR